MRTPSKLILATLATTALLALAGSTASARNLRFSERNFEFIWNNALGGAKEKLRFIDAAGLITECKVTFLGSFVERTISKQTTRKIAEIKHAQVEACNANTEAEFRAFPWEVFYRSFTGTLPNIRSISIGIVKLEFRTRSAAGTECIEITTNASPAVFILEEIEARGGVESITAEERSTIPLGGRCAFLTPLNFRGKGLVRNLPGTELVTVTLI